MRPLHRLFSRSATNSRSAGDDEVEKQPWNTLMTLQSGEVADVDSRGAVYLRRRPVSVEIWFGHGERWVRGTAGDGVRQTRVDGLPIIETRQKLDDGDIVQTVWADEAGAGQARIVVELSNECQVSVVAAVIVRPRTLLGGGSMKKARVAESLIVIDGSPLVELGRKPGAVVTSIDSPDAAGLLDQLELGESTIDGVDQLEDPNGEVSIAAIIPLTRGADRQIEILEGPEQATVAPAPLDTVRTGWKSHLADAGTIDLPGWPNHLPTALLSSLLGSTASTGRPLGDSLWSRLDDSMRAVALARAGFGWASAHVADVILTDVTEGRIERGQWVNVAAVVASIVGYPEGIEVLQRHADAVAAVAGNALSEGPHPNVVPRLVLAVHHTHGPAAAEDAASIERPKVDQPAAVGYWRYGFGVHEDHVELIEGMLGAGGLISAEMIGLAMTASAVRPIDPIVPIRSLAGSTWRWQRRGCGDSPNARAYLYVGLASLAVTEKASESSGVDIDVFGGATPQWLGQKMSITSVPTLAGRLSAAVRWHGERAALLWEFESEPVTGANDIDFALTCERLDPSFSSTERSGEALLEVPEALLAERDAVAKKSPTPLI